MSEAGSNAGVEPIDLASFEGFDQVIRPSRGLVPINFAELWRYRELLWFLAWRDILVRYKQTVIGVLWVLVQPLLTMVILTVIFGRLAKMDSQGVPYAILTLAAILPWQFFSAALLQSSNSLVAQSNLVSKVYFPRLILPLSSIVSAGFDFLVSLGLLLVMMPLLGVSFRMHLLLLPAFALVAVLATLCLTMWLSAMNVKYRDVKHVVPFIVRMGMYLSPVGFLSSVIPEEWRFWYSLNPMVGVIDGFRWCILGPDFAPYWPGLILGLAGMAVLLVGGVYYFRATEKTFADVI